MHTTTDPLNLGLIVRTSQREAGARSPQQQRDMADATTQSWGHRIVRTYDSGKGESGKTMDRFTINAARADLQAGVIDGVIVALADRLGRAPIEEAMSVVREFTTLGKLVLADMGGAPLDLSNGVSETNVVMQLQFARQYWLATASRMRRSQVDAIAAGKHVGPTPLGYARRAGKLHPHPTYAPVISETYRRAAHDGLDAAVAYLREQVPTRPAAGRRKASTDPWNTASVRKLLASPTYLGKVHTGDLELPGAHAALTTPETWHAAQTAPRPRRSNGGYPLTGIAKCVCGAGLQGQLQSFKDREQTYRRYRCSSKACRGGSSIGADALEDYVRTALQGQARMPGWRLRFVPGDVDAARAEVESCETELDTFLQTVRPSAPGYGRAYAVCQQRLDAAQAAFSEIASHAARTVRVPTAEELTDDDQFVRGLALARTDIRVRRGRGDIDSRVDVRFWQALDDSAGVLAA